MKPRLLDLFCCEGGAAMGYARAGFEVHGVDVQPQERYPYAVTQGDALAILGDRDFVGEFDAIHASPPCQRYSMSTKSHRNEGKHYPDLLGPTRAALLQSGLPWVIENVPGAPMRADLILCGSQFGLKIVRHRWFEFSFPVSIMTPACSHDRMAITITGNGTPSYTRLSREKAGIARNVGIGEKREIMGMPWASVHGLSQAIPPVYAEFVGRLLLAAVRERAA